MSARVSAFELPQSSAIARLQRAAGTVIWLAGISFAIWGLREGRSGVAATGILLLLLTPMLICIQCALMALSNRSGAARQLESLTGVTRVAPLAISEIFAVWWQESLTAWRVFSFWQPWRWRAEPNVVPQLGRAELVGSGPTDSVSPVGPRGVVLVHGFFCNRGLWRAHLRRLQAQGVPCIAVNLEPAFGGIDAYASILDRAVTALEQSTGQPPIILAHSMGGLAARAWLRTTLASRVHRVITIGTPHHGTSLAALAVSVNGQQMRFMSGWLQALAADEEKSPSIREKFVCVYSDGDNIVFPSATATLVRARTHFVAACGHVSLVDHRDTQALLDAALREPLAG